MATKKTTPADQAVKVYKQYTKDLQSEYGNLLQSLEKFLKNIRKKAEAVESKKEAKLLSKLDKSLKAM